MNRLASKALSIIAAIAILALVLIVIATLSLPDQNGTREEPSITAIPENLPDMPIFFQASAEKNENGIYETIVYFNTVADDDDFIVFPENSLLTNKQQHLAAIQQVERGRIVQTFSSWARAEEYISFLAEKIDGISYDLENWEKSNGEWENIALSSQKMSTIAEEYNLEYIAHLGVNLATNNPDDPRSIQNMAEYADSYSFAAYQCLAESSTTECIDLYTVAALYAQSVNPDIYLIMGISLEHETEFRSLYKLVSDLGETYDALGVYYLPGEAESQSRFHAFIDPLRDKSSVSE